MKDQAETTSPHHSKNETVLGCFSTDASMSIQETSLLIHEESKDASIKIEKTADPLNGLRGLLSLHIVLHHLFFYSTFNLNLMGAVSFVPILKHCQSTVSTAASSSFQVQLPIFFILSGFGLTLGML